MGVNIGFEDPFDIPIDPPDPDMGPGTPALMPGVGETGKRCSLDGIIVDCGFVAPLMESGAAVVAPNQTTIPLYNKKDGKFSGWGFFNPTAGGYEYHAVLQRQIISGGAVIGEWWDLVKQPEIVHIDVMSGESIGGGGRSTSLGFAFGFQAQRQRGGGGQKTSQSPTPAPGPNCATPNSIINSPEFKNLFEQNWERSLKSGEENGVAIFYEKATNQYHKFQLSEGRHIDFRSTDGQRVVYSLPAMPDAEDEVAIERSRYYRERREIYFMAFFHTHPSGGPDPTGAYGDVDLQKKWWYPLGIIRSEDGYSFYMGNTRSFGPDSFRADKCIWQLTQEKRNQ